MPQLDWFDWTRFFPAERAFRDRDVVAVFAEQIDRNPSVALACLAAFDVLIDGISAEVMRKHINQGHDTVLTADVIQSLRKRLRAAIDDVLDQDQSENKNWRRVHGIRRIECECIASKRDATYTDG